MDLVKLMTGKDMDSPDEQLDYFTSGAATMAVAAAAPSELGRDAAALAQKHGLTLAGANSFLEWDRRKNGRATVEDWVAGWWLDNPDAFVENFAKFSAGDAVSAPRSAPSSVPAPSGVVGAFRSAVSTATKTVTSSTSSISPMLLPALGIGAAVAIAIVAIKHSSSNAAVKL